MTGELEPGEVRKHAPALYWNQYEAGFPATCAVCPFGQRIVSDPEDLLGGLFWCRLKDTQVDNAREPICTFVDWQERARLELRILWPEPTPEKTKRPSATA